MVTKLASTFNLHKTLSKLDQIISKEAQQVAVAVSGGADSMALCLMLNEYLANAQTKLVALTVDHKLRPESTSEAQQVHQWLTDYDIEHHVLTWNHDHKSFNQESAREARYTLLTNYCHSHAIPTLFTAHHSADQMETFLMRLARSSGLSGLCGIGETTEYKGVLLCRPLLNTHPDELKAYLRERNQPWIEDPSNSSDKYERNRLRKQTDALENIGLSPDTIGKSTSKLHEANQALDWAADQWIQANVHLDQNLKFAACLNGFHSLPIELSRRVMLRVASFIRGKTISSKYIRDNLKSPYQKLLSKPFNAFTWAGCYWFEHKGKIYICREWSKCPVGLDSRTNLYDHRFYLPGSNDLELVPVGREHWPIIKAYVKDRQLPYQIFLSLPISFINGSNTPVLLSQFLKPSET